MANQRLWKKVAPVVLSAAVVMTSMPATAFAADFSDYRSYCSRGKC